MNPVAERLGEVAFGQYAPYEISDGDCDSRRNDVAKQFIDLISHAGVAIGAAA